jgi:hypothetical protein
VLLLALLNVSRKELSRRSTVDLFTQRLFDKLAGFDTVSPSKPLRLNLAVAF